MDSNSHGVILTTFIGFLIACDLTEQNQFDDLPGPCIIRRTKLPRLEPVKVKNILYSFYNVDILTIASGICFNLIPNLNFINNYKLNSIMILLHQVGYVRQIELTKDEKPFTVKTLSVRPPIFGRYTGAFRKILLHELTAVSRKIVM